MKQVRLDHALGPWQCQHKHDQLPAKCQVACARVPTISNLHTSVSACLLLNNTLALQEQRFYAPNLAINPY